MSSPTRLKIKAVVFLNNIVPYHNARWRSASELLFHCTLVEVTNCDEFKALEVESKSDNAYERVTLFPNKKLEEISKKELSDTIGALLDREHPDVIFVNGYSFFYNWIALEWGLAHGVPVVICSESNEHDESRKWFKEGIKRFFVSRCAAGLAGGSPQASYLEKLGIPNGRLFTGYDVVDNNHFEMGSKQAIIGGDELRAKLGLPKHYFFACARFGKKKNLPFLIQAYAAYRRRIMESDRKCSESLPWNLVIAGEGEERVLIEKKIRECGVEEHVYLIGPKGYAELPSYYGLAGTFIHASTTEQWGLVVNEAMAAGLPVLVSERCGCAVDLVNDGMNGWKFNPNNLDQLVTLMVVISADPELRRSLGKVSRDSIANWGESKFARGAIATVESSLKTPRKKYGLFERVVFSLISLR